jgi:hypothetical protein
VRKSIRLVLGIVVALSVLAGSAPALANVDIYPTSSLGCEWAGGSSISGNSGQGQTTDWNGSNCLYSVGVWIESFCDWTGCWGYLWEWEPDENIIEYTGGDCSLGCYIQSRHQVTAPGVPGSQIIQTSTN